MVVIVIDPVVGEFSVTVHGEKLMSDREVPAGAVSVSDALRLDASRGDSLCRQLAGRVASP